MYPHRIRLRGPWECEPLARRPGDDRPLPPALRMTMPCHWGNGGLGDFAGRARFRRRFGYPGRIDAHERVWLTAAGLSGTAIVGLNGHELGKVTDQGFEYEVTSLLAARNELVVEVEAEGGQGGLWGEVALEVRCTAYLRGVRAWAEGPVLHVAGEVVGTAERPLDLYVLLEGRNAGYTMLEAAPEGRPFQLLCEPREDLREGASVRVELVNAATVWYAVEMTV